MSVKLNLGCGTKNKDGWVNIDSAAQCHPDILHDLSEPLPFEDQSAEEIFADAVLEHFDKYARYEPPPELIKPIVDKYLGIDIFQHKKEAYVAADPDGPAFRAGVPEIGKLAVKYALHRGKTTVTAKDIVLAFKSYKCA